MTSTIHEETGDGRYRRIFSVCSSTNNLIIAMGGIIRPFMGMIFKPYFGFFRVTS
jgi:hypothetical protein